MSVCKVNTLVEVGRFLELEHRVYDGINHWVPGQKNDITRIITGNTAFSSYIDQQAETV